MDINRINYVQRKFGKAAHTGIEMFDTFIPEVGGLLRLTDIRKAYLKASGEPADSRKKTIAHWKESPSTKDLLDYMLSELSLPEIRVMNTSRGGDTALSGTYVCRELAHSYAMYCDARYAYHVLQAFDQLVKGQLGAALGTATKVAKPIIEMEWEDRYDRLVGHIGDEKEVIEYFNYFIDDIYYEVVGSNLKDPLAFRNYVYQNIGESLIFERLLNCIEIAKLFKDDGTEVTAVLQQFDTDPEFPAFIELVKAYEEKL